MKRSFTIHTLFCHVLLAVFSVAASAETLFSTGYEPPTYSVGPLDGQDGWDAQFFDVAEVTSDFSRSGFQSLEFGVDVTNEFAQRAGSFSTSEPIVMLRQAVYIDGPDEDALIPDGFFIRAVGFSGDNPDNTEDGGFLGQLTVVNGEGPLGLGANLGLAEEAIGFVPVEVGDWFVLEHVLNLATQTQEAYVDGQFIASAPFVNPATEVSGVEIVVLNAGNHTVYLDDLSVTAVPEPSTLSLLAVAGLFSLRLRRQRRA